MNITCPMPFLNFQCNRMVFVAILIEQSKKQSACVSNSLPQSFFELKEEACFVTTIAYDLIKIQCISCKELFSAQSCCWKITLLFSFNCFRHAFQIEWRVFLIIAVSSAKDQCRSLPFKMQYQHLQILTQSIISCHYLTVANG